MIEIGAENNTRVEIYDLDFPGAPAISVPVNDMLKCEELRPLWVSWEDGCIKVGSGAHPEDVVATYVDHSFSPIVGVGLDSFDWDEQSIARWQFTENAVSGIRQDILPEITLPQLRITVSEQTEIIVFRLKSKGNVAIRLSKNPDLITADMYEIQLGWGDEEEEFNVLIDGERVMSKKLPDVMGKGEEFKPWTISWQKHMILVRQEDLLILDYYITDATMQFTSMALMSNFNNVKTDKSIIEFDHLEVFTHESM